MTQEEKDLLLRDLCTRLPYGVKVEVNFTEGKKVKDLSGYAYIINQDICVGCSWMPISNNIKIYLRQMSSMTEEEKLYLELNYGFELYGNVLSNLHIIKSGGYYEREGEYVEPTEYRQYTHITIDTVSELIKWLNAHHFDYRRLIEKGLALEAPEGMYNIKEK